MGEAAEKLAENTPRTVPAQLIPHIWKKGDPSPNPGGRPKGLATFIREQTKDGQELATILLEIARGQRKAFLRPSDQLKAIEMLLDRAGFPKAISSADSPNALPSLELAELTSEELGAIEHFGFILASIRERLTSRATETQSK